jgi:signal transduction histidine kinase
LGPVQPGRDTPLSIPDRQTTQDASQDSRGDPTPPSGILVSDGLRVRPESAAAERLSDQASLAALVSSARHELRSPLHAIQGFADLLASEAYGALGTDQRVFVEHIVQGSTELSRALDACFELLQAELLHLPVEIMPFSVRRLLEEAFTLARPKHTATVEAQLDDLPDELTAEVDLQDFQKAVAAVLTALASLNRGPIAVRAAGRGGRIDITFSGVGLEPMALKPLDGRPRRNASARALLWLRVARSLVARGRGELFTSEKYEQVRIALPAGCDA